MVEIFQRSVDDKRELHLLARAWEGQSRTFEWKERVGSRAKEGRERGVGEAGSGPATVAGLAVSSCTLLASVDQRKLAQAEAFHRFLHTECPLRRGLLLVLTKPGPKLGPVEGWATIYNGPFSPPPPHAHSLSTTAGNIGDTAMQGSVTKRGTHREKVTVKETDAKTESHLR